MIDQQDSPATKTPEASFMADERSLIGTLMAGTGAMRSAGKKYLPQFPAETDKAYSYRLSVSTLYNGMRRTIETLAGKPFSEPLQFGESVPTQLQDWCDDVDLQGRDLHSFAHAVFVQALADGLSHVLVEYPVTQPGATLAEKQATGARPYFVHIKHDQILGWRSERINGVETLIELRIMECVNEHTGKWLVNRIEQIRVLRPDEWETYRQNERKEWVLHEQGAVTLGAVPLSTVYADRCAFMQARPPLLDLAYLNIKHWQKESDHDNLVHTGSVPILFASGFSDDLVIGANAAIRNDDPNAKLQYVEISGKALEAGASAIKELEQRMALMGAQLLVKKPGTRTATETAIDTAESDSALSLMVRNLEDSLEYALQFMADWEGIGPAGEVELTGDIGGLDDMDTAGLLKARELGLLSAETVFGEMQRRGVVSDDIEWAEEAARLAGEPKESDETPSDDEAIESPPSFDLTTVVAAIRESKPEPLDVAALAAMLKPEPLDASPMAEALRAGMESVSAAVGAIGAAVAAIKPAAAPNITAPIHVDAPAPVDLTSIAEAIKANGEAMAAALGAIKPALTLVQQRSNSATIREADGSETIVTLN